jgi:hypothetical protein
MDGREMEIKKDELLRKADLLMELRGYHKENLYKDKEWIDLEVSKPTSDETVLLRIITHSNLKMDGVGVKQVREAERILEEPNVDKVILFGKRFTKAARRELREKAMEFFPPQQWIVSTLNQQDV